MSYFSICSLSRFLVMEVLKDSTNLELLFLLISWIEISQTHQCRGKKRNREGAFGIHFGNPGNLGLEEGRNQLHLILRTRLGFSKENSSGHCLETSVLRLASRRSAKSPAMQQPTIPAV
ncbi:uncharacterized protein LOC116663180 isoform X2 [Camelus ferus]|uniref:Uncharacterized protein LOC116663180 isoform X2 n=1 Tax=Camelus ferus TaxID=419612 RepID=A0A8B8SUM3_CAMFR|nr:uncharacterized protein LOC116663180 isoform X2 [Camelus ferus]